MPVVLVLPWRMLHLIQRGNNRQACFFADKDYRACLDWLADSAHKAGCRIHAYVLMTNHVHLLVSTARSESLGEMMKSLGQRYVQYVNRSYRRSGSLYQRVGKAKRCASRQS